MADPEAKPPAAAAAGKSGDPPAPAEVQVNASLKEINLPQVNLLPVLASLSNSRVEHNPQWPLSSLFLKPYEAHVRPLISYGRLCSCRCWVDGEHKQQQREKESLFETCHGSILKRLRSLGLGNGDGLGHLNCSAAIYLVRIFILH